MPSEFADSAVCMCAAMTHDHSTGEPTGGEAAFQAGMRAASQDAVDVASPAGERVTKRSRSDPSAAVAAKASTPNGVQGIVLSIAIRACLMPNELDFCVHR